MAGVQQGADKGKQNGEKGKMMLKMQRIGMVEQECGLGDGEKKRQRHNAKEHARRSCFTLRKNKKNQERDQKGTMMVAG